MVFTSEDQFLDKEEHRRGLNVYLGTLGDVVDLNQVVDDERRVGTMEDSVVPGLTFVCAVGDHAALLVAGGAVLLPVVGVGAHGAAANLLQVLSTGGLAELHELRAVIQAMAHIGLVGLGGDVVVGFLVTELAVLCRRLLSPGSTSAASPASWLAVM